ncbi:hypothetical protein V490_02979 [Pseudogymnoascus sp. VKM F-3557]|nr:hypothetical protein V490_02979 [Pseudogymnoascus sp. VKM F-3557]
MIKGKKKRWFWYCTVCDRCSQSIKNTLRDESNCDGNSIPGVSWCCDTWFIGASVLRIGVMGWLLSCRQAYAECIDILYTTNTIFLYTNRFIINDLPRLILPLRFTSITSIKMRWTYDPFGWEYDYEEWEHSEYGFLKFNSLLKRLPEAFPHLKRLHISLEGMMYAYSLNDQLPRMVESNIMVPLDGMVRKFGPNTQSFVVSIPASIYTVLKYHSNNTTEQEIPKLRTDWARLWRELPASDSEDPQPNNLKGYWIRIGQLDVDIEPMLERGIHVTKDMYYENYPDDEG